MLDNRQLYAGAALADIDNYGHTILLFTAFLDRLNNNVQNLNSHNTNTTSIGSISVNNYSSRSKSNGNGSGNKSVNK